MYPESLTCLVTGASSGIGKAISYSLMKQGYRVIGVSRNMIQFENLATKHADSYYGLEMDLCDSQSVSTIFERLPGSWKKIDVLVNCAGSDLGGRTNFDAGDIDDWLNTIDTNIKGVMRLTHLLIKPMLQRNYGDIINIGSVSGVKPLASISAYSASKHALNGFSESLRLEHENTNIRVMQVLPGRVKTQFAGVRLKNHEKGIQYYEDTNHWLLPEDVADTVIFMLKQPRNVVIPQLIIEPRSKC